MTKNVKYIEATFRYYASHRRSSTNSNQSYQAIRGGSVKQLTLLVPNQDI